MQKSVPFLVACLLAMAAAGASAQSIWKWRDAGGQMHVSDTPPPSDVPDKNIIQRGRGGVAAPMSVAAAPAASAANANGGADSELQKKKAKAEKEKTEQDAAEKAAVDKKNAETKAENCRRAQAQAGALQSGVRISQVDAKGERHYLDDGQRASELQHAQEIIRQNCQ